MTELEIRDINLRLGRLEQNLPNDFLLGLYTDLVRQHINLLKDLVHNRFSREDFENQIRLERDVRILEKNLVRLTEILSGENTVMLRANMNEMEIATSN